MEESEKRRERLRAMRMEAAEADVGDHAEISLPNQLSNPLAESSAAMVAQSEPCNAPRFDYYTNPMAAFSSTRKRGNQTYVPSHHNDSPATYVPSNFPGLRNPEMSSSPTHQFHQHSPDQRTFYARGFSGSGGYGGSPAMPRPFPMDQRTPDMRHGPRSPFGYHFPGPPPRGMSSPNVVSGPRGISYSSPTQDRVNYHSPSPSPGYQGRGRHGYRGDMTPGPRFGSGRGRGSGSHGHRFSSDQSPRPEQFYSSSMLEDPWKVLQPGIWKTVAPSSGSASATPSESWVSKFGSKKARASDSSAGRSGSQPSLAEYLAASFNEAVNEAPNV